MNIKSILKKNDVPKAKPGRKPISRALIEDFLVSEAEAIEVDCEGESPLKVYNALYQYSRTKGSSRHIHFPIEVRKNGDKVYIMRADEVKE